MDPWTVLLICILLVTIPYWFPLLLAVLAVVAGICVIILGGIVGFACWASDRLTKR